MGPYCASMNIHSFVGLNIRQWEAVDWACVLCDRRIHNDQASRSASSRQSSYPFYSSRAGSFGKTSHHPGLSAALKPRFGSLRLLPFPKAKIAVEREENCECYGHTIHKLSQRRLTANSLAPRESDCSRMYSKVSSDWLPSYIKATRPVLEIFKMAGYFPDSPRTANNFHVPGRRMWYTPPKHLYRCQTTRYFNLEHHSINPQFPQNAEQIFPTLNLQNNISIFDTVFHLIACLFLRLFWFGFHSN